VARAVNTERIPRGTTGRGLGILYQNPRVVPPVPRFGHAELAALGYVIARPQPIAFIPHGRNQCYG